VPGSALAGHLIGLAATKAQAIPGVAVAIWAQGRAYLRGYEVTNVDYPTTVDGGYGTTLRG